MLCAYNVHTFIFLTNGIIKSYSNYRVTQALFVKLEATMADKDINKCFSCNRLKQMCQCAGGGSHEEELYKEQEHEFNQKNMLFAGAPVVPQFKLFSASLDSFFAAFQNTIPPVQLIANDDSISGLLQIAEGIARTALNCEDHQTLKINYNSKLRDPNFNPTYSELNTYATFQKQTGLSIKIDGKDICNEQFEILKENDDFMNSIKKITSALFQDTANETNTNRVAASPSPFNTRPTLLPNSQ